MKVGYLWDKMDADELFQGPYKAPPINVLRLKRVVPPYIVQHRRITCSFKQTQDIERGPQGAQSRSRRPANGLLKAERQIGSLTNGHQEPTPGGPGQSTTRVVQITDNRYAALPYLTNLHRHVGRAGGRAWLERAFVRQKVPPNKDDTPSGKKKTHDRPLNLKPVTVWFRYDADEYVFVSSPYAMIACI